MSEEKKPIVVGTYNMSWASDQGNNDPKPGKSEALFLQGVDEGNKREFWNNAKHHLMQFIKEKKPLAVGLQEMNVPLSQIAKLEDLSANNVVLENDGKHEEMKNSADIFQKDINENYGTLAIKNELNESEYKIYSGVVLTTFKSNVSLAIILSSSEIMKTMKIVDQKNSKQENIGRPLLMILTENDNLFVNMHGDQTPPFSRFVKEFNETMDKNITFLQDNVKEFLGSVIPKNIYIMGDFNDRYNHIKNFTIKDIEVPLHIEEENVPKSCCFNIDSMGTEGISQFKIFNNIGEFLTKFENDEKFKKFKTDNGYNFETMENMDKAKAIDAFLVKIEAGQDNDEKFGYLKSKQGNSKFTQGLRRPENAHSKIEEKIMSKQMRDNENENPFKDHGIAIKNYVNMGDKVFSTNKITSLNIYTGSDPEHLSKPSNKSDHELVYAEISPSSEAQPSAPAEGEAPPAEAEEVTDTSAEEPADKTEKSTEQAEGEKSTEASADTTGGLFGGSFGGKKKTKKRKSSKKKTKKKRKGKRKGGTKKLNTTHKK
jgi:hypothetical protein